MLGEALANMEIEPRNTESMTLSNKHQQTVNTSVNEFCVEASQSNILSD